MNVLRIGCVGGLLAWVMVVPGRSASGADLPGFPEVEAAVAAALETDRKYESGDVLARKQASAVLNALERIGWKMKDRASFEKLFLDDGAYIVQKLRSRDGRKFTKQIGKMPMGIDQLDRMSQLPQGRSTVDRLIKGPDGYKLFEYMNYEKGGRELGKMLSKDGQGDFNKPTGKIYTEEQLIAELKKRHDEAKAAALKSLEPVSKPA